MAETTWVQRTSPSTVVVRRGARVVLALIDDGEVDRLARELLATNPQPQKLIANHNEWARAGDGCTCFVNPNPFTYYGAVEPGDALEADPACPEHFPKSTSDGGN